MVKSLRGRLITIVIVILAATWQLYRTYGDYGSPVKLGLDLQGGMHLVLGIDDPEGTLTPEARADAIDRAERIVRTRIDELGVEEPLIQQQGDERLIVELAGISDQAQARGIVSQAAFLEFKLVESANGIVEVLPRIDRAIVAAMGEERLREMGRVQEAPVNDLENLIFQGSGDSAAADTSGTAGDTTAASEPAMELRPLSSLLSQGNVILEDGSQGSFWVLAEDVPTVEEFLALPEVRRALPRDLQLSWGEDPEAAGARTYRSLYVLSEDAFMTGSELEDAQAQRDPQFNQAVVLFQLSRAGGRMFRQFTTQHVGDYLAILLDGEVISAPVIREPIGDRGQIDMGSSPLEEAADLALVLRAGALPAPLRIMEERTVGPSLGQDSIDQGEVAGIVGLLTVVAVMILYYRMAGVLAIGALTVYVLLVMGGLAGLNASLTLPGIAGLILSVGMAVDANVLIFERIREELVAGRATRTAVDEGFAHALSAIVDANITTLLTALILFQFGTGPVRGFAVTLSIGIVASFFSALYVTRTFFLLYLERKKASDPISI
jgi:preprotein translocase subunit SecD